MISKEEKIFTKIENLSYFLGCFRLIIMGSNATLTVNFIFWEITYEANGRPNQSNRESG